METLQQFFPNYYRDSVALMQLSAKVAAREGVKAASAQMATAANIQLMVDAKLLKQAVDAKPNDLLVVIQADSVAIAEDALAFIKTLLEENSSSGNQQGGVAAEPPRSIAMGIELLPDANLAMISTPGDFAAGEAMKALKNGLNVMLFSDNVSVEQEIALKQYAEKNDLLVMGPDCGTAIIQGIPLAFANVVSRGNIGVIGASGTGIQQVTCLIDQLGYGISHAIGTGGHDLSEAVGGITMRSALTLLEKDPATDIIVLISKPPADSVARQLVAAAQKISKPVVINFLGADPALRTDLSQAGDNITWADTLESAAYLAVGLIPNARVKQTDKQQRLSAFNEVIAKRTPLLKADQVNVRGLYTGGTFCYEAQLLLAPHLKECRSNTPIKSLKRLDNIWQSQGHTIIDLGDDDFTRGKPHPMIDPSTRNERLLQEASDPSTAIILVDLVLGYGAHENPAEGLVGTIEQASKIAAAAGRTLFFVGFICGTQNDPQQYQKQQQLLQDAGVLLAESNAHATEIVAAIIASIAQKNMSSQTGGAQ